MSSIFSTDVSSIWSLDMSSSLMTVGAIAIAGLVIFLKLAKVCRKGQGLPWPGPTLLPFFGNALSIRASEPWVTYAEWGSRYGDIFKTRIFGENILVIHSAKVAEALLEHRSSVYSDRPYYAARVPYGWSFHFAWEPHGERWRLRRKLFNQFFRAEAALEHRPIQLQKARQLVLNLLNDADNHRSHIQRFSAAIIMSILYDYELSPERDHFVELFERGAAIALEGLVPENSAIINTFPFVLRLPTWLPGSRFSRRAALSKECADEMVSAPFEYSRKREADEIASSAMIPNLLRSEKYTDDPSTIQLFKDVAASGFIAGAQTSTVALDSFCLAMLQNPDVQKRAQAEVDEVVGLDRLPNFDDRPRLPYVEAVLRETLRLYPVVPLAMAHATVSDDVFEGYFIPKGSTVVPNVWAMLHNPDVYPEPDSFKPERYFKDGELDDEVSTSHIGYGFGRRTCPGRFTADASIWVAMVTILSTLTISKALDDKGREINVDPKFTCGLTAGPLPFPCKIVPRRADFDAEKFSEMMKAI
ncbi:cytochrome P450 [Paxillus ammoniavirescens]|nr:cytochrome P450 [Paxillus ammoniavirescens]